MRAAFVRAALVVFVAFTALFAVEFVVEWYRLGAPGWSDVSWAGVNNAKLVDVLSPMARAYNNILAMLIATIGLAIPLTANMHTPKLIDMFLRDRLNQTMLLLFALGAANVLFVDYLIGPHFAPVWSIRVAVFGSLLGWALLIPYFFYVVRFLDPSNIIARLKNETTRAVDLAVAGKRDLEAAQDDASERLYQTGTIILKSLDRADRGVALEGIWSLKRILDHYGALKARMPEAWFKVDRKDFVGYSAEALELINEEKTWFELKVQTQMFLAYQHALAKTSDVVASISDANRVVAVNAASRGDANALELALKYFNTFLREAIKRKDTRAIYDVFYQYRLLARDLRDHPAVLSHIARYFRYYSDMARDAGIGFIPQLAAFDLGFITRRAYEAGSTAAGELLDQTLGLPHTHKGELLLLVLKAKIILGAFFEQRGLTSEAATVRRNLADVPISILARCESELLAAERVFWEVTERQVNLEYVPPERREYVQAFVASFHAEAAQ